MSRRRYISTDISTDPKLAILAEHGTLPMLLFTWAIPHMDDWGRMSGDPLEFKLQVCPALSLTPEEIQETLEKIKEVELWELYEVNGKQYISINSDKWFKHQTYINKEKRGNDSGSKFPAPPSFQQERKTPKNTEEQQRAPQKSVSPSPSI